MNTNVWIKTSLASVIALTVAACGSRGSGIDFVPTKSITSNVSLGNPLSGATCTIAPFNVPGTVLDTATTDAAGNVTFEVPEEVGITLIKCTGGTFTPKATNGTELSAAFETRRTTVATARTHAFTTLFTRFLVTLPANTITSTTDLAAQTVNILKALGLEGISYDDIVSGNLTSEQQKQVNLFAITLANDLDLLVDLVQAIRNGFIPATLAAELNLALQATAARLPPSELPATIPVVIGGSTTPTGGTGTGGST